MDKEVGELWREFTQIKEAFRSNAHDVVRELICKLIEERAQNINYPSRQVSYQRACSDFGIEFAEYLKAKEQP